MNIYNILLEKFNKTEPIFDYEIYELGYTDTDINDTLKENVFVKDNTDIVPVAVYQLVEKIEIFGDTVYSKIDSMTIMYKYYVGYNNEFGRLSGLALLGQLGMSNQTCFAITIMSKRVDSTINIDRNTIYSINDKNEDIVLSMYVEALTVYKKYLDISFNDAINISKNRLTSEQFDKLISKIQDDK